MPTTPLRTAEKKAPQILRVPMRDIRADLVVHTQELKHLCRDERRRPDDRCKDFSDRLKSFVTTELLNRGRLHSACRLFGFMVWNTERKLYERQMVYNIPAEADYTAQWSATIFANVFLEKDTENRISLTYREGGRRRTRRLAELGSDLIFSAPFDHRPTIVVDLVRGRGSHKKLAAIPNIYEVDLGFARDNELLSKMTDFRHAYFGPTGLRDQDGFADELRAFLSELGGYSDEWKKDFERNPINLVRKERSIAENLLALLTKRSYDLQDLFYTKITNLLMFPDARHLYFVPADIIQYEPSGGFFFVATERIDDDDILRWNQLALTLFTIVSSIPTVEQQIERATFAHRHLGLIGMLEDELKRIHINTLATRRISSIIVAIKAAFLPSTGRDYDGLRLFDRTLDQPLDAYINMAASLALRRLAREKEYLEVATQYLAMDDGENIFLNKLGLVLPCQAEIAKHHSTIARENFGLMFIQMLDQALFHSFLAKDHGYAGELRPRVVMEEVRGDDGEITQLRVLVINPASEKGKSNMFSKDQREFKQLGQHLTLDDVEGPAPIGGEGKEWCASFTILYWGGQRL
jgi:hypothetical protein